MSNSKSTEEIKPIYKFWLLVTSLLFLIAFANVYKYTLAIHIELIENIQNQQPTEDSHDRT